VGSLTLSITLPWPPVGLTPNQKRKHHWSKYRKTEAAYRQSCWWTTREAMGRNRFAALTSVEVHFYPPDLRIRDDDGIIASFKNGRDGVADATRIDDQHWRPQYHFHEPHLPAGKVVVVLSGEAKA
jgi:crossover junction endodeoxyribonuclease RusA